MLECWKTLTLESVLQVDSNKIKNLEGSQRTLKLWKETFLSCVKPKILIDVENIRKLLYNSVNGEKIKLSKVDFRITSTVLPSFKLVKIFKEDMITNPLEYILASLYLPIFRPQKIIDGKNYLDIADLRRNPLEILKEKEHNQIYIVDISDGKKRKLQKDIIRTNFDDDKSITVINMDYKASLLDFSEKQAITNYKKGYETSMKVLSKTLR